MDKYQMFDAIRQYQKNLQHAQSKLYGTQQSDAKYYRRIGEPGNYRYFYTKEAWDAYQKELSSKNIDPNNGKMYEDLAQKGKQQIQKVKNYDKNAKLAEHEGDRWKKKESSIPYIESKIDYEELTKKGHEHKAELEAQERRRKADETISDRENEISRSREIAKENIQKTEAELQKASALSSQLDAAISSINYYDDTVKAGNSITTKQLDTINNLLSELRNLEAKNEYGVPIQINKMSTADNLKYINYGRLTGDSDYHNNCAACTINMELRERGYDVTAPTYNNYGKDEEGNTPYGSSGWLKNIYGDSIKLKNGYAFDGKTTTDFVNDITSEPEGSYGYMSISWKSGGSHAVFYKIENGKAIIYDGQTAKINTNLNQYLDRCLDYTYYRTDNLEVNFAYLVQNGYIKYD